MIASAIEQPERQPDDEHEHAYHEVEGALHRPVPTGENRRTELEERRPLARDVLPALHEELGRLRREADADPLPVRLLDDLEDGALVERGLREDHLVGTHLLQDTLEVLTRSEQAQPRRRILRHGADELVREPAPRGGERAPEVGQALPLADQDHAPADPGETHELE